VAYRGTSIHYDINGLKAEEFFTNIDAVRPPTPLLYYDILQKSPLFASGAEVGESPHGLEGSYIYVSIIYSIRNPWCNIGIINYGQPILKPFKNCGCIRSKIIRP
jgi:hypothetical protein